MIQEMEPSRAKALQDEVRAALRRERTRAKLSGRELKLISDMLTPAQNAFNIMAERRHRENIAKSRPRKDGPERAGNAGTDVHHGFAGCSKILGPLSSNNRDRVIRMLVAWHAEKKGKTK